MALSARQQRFAENYTLTNGNGAEAARRAGYCDKGLAAGVEAHRLLKNPNVQAEVERLWGETAKQFDVSRQQIIEGILKETESDNGNTRLKAWELLAKIHGLLAPAEHESTQIKFNLNLG